MRLNEAIDAAIERIARAADVPAHSVRLSVERSREGLGLSWTAEAYMRSRLDRRERWHKVGWGQTAGSTAETAEAFIIERLRSQEAP